MRNRIIYIFLLLAIPLRLAAADYTVSVTTNTCSDPKTYTIPEGEQMVLHAHPIAGYTFSQWSDGNTENPRIVTITSDVSYMAEFVAMSPMPTIHNVVVSADGCVSKELKVVDGSAVKIYPHAKLGYTFSQWSDGNTDNPRIAIINTDATFVAQFKELDEIAPDGMFTIVVKADGCGTALTQNISTDTEVKLYAHPEECNYFTQWSDGNTDNPRTVVVTEDIEYTAVFDVAKYDIQALSNDDELGRVSITQPTVPYLGFTATADNSSIRMRYGGTLAGAQPKLQYSYDSQTWNTFVLGTTYNVAKDQTFYMRGQNPNGASIRFDGYSYFIMEGSFEGSGNIMSLIDTTCTATETPDYCFYRLFYNCTSLTKSPELTATTLGYNCYANMFRGCTNLSHITVDITSWDADATVNWVSGVSSTGTFVKPSALSVVNGTSYIPDGWITQDRTTNSSSTGVSSGSYECGSTITLTATPSDCAHFTKWSDGNTDNPRTVVVNGDKTYTAVFQANQYTITAESADETQGTVTIELVDDTPSTQGIGTFSVSATKQVTFSPGNLQYTQSTNTWSFAENQYDYIGTDNVIGGTVSSSSFGDSILGTALADKVDLFGLSTSTTNFGVSISIDSENDYSGSFIDWGTNKIDDDAPSTWRTLSYNEWDYLVNNRNNASSLCGVAQVSGVNGLIILPDNWVCPSGVTFKSGFHSNRGVDYYAAYQSFTAEQWAELESAGAVFLPAVGLRSGTRLKYVQCNGDYWSSTEDDSSSAYYLYFYSDGTHKGDSARSSGRSVRLVKDLR